MNIGDLIQLGLGLAGKLGAIAADAYAASHEEAQAILQRMLDTIAETDAQLRAAKSAHDARVASFRSQTEDQG